MPTYEYACKQCGEHLDVVQRFTDEVLTTCPGCGGSLRKVFGNIGISFKGSGFYKNDSRTSGNEAKQEKQEKKDAKEESPSSAKTESTTTSGDSASSSDAAKPKPSKADAPTAAP